MYLTTHTLTWSLLAGQLLHQLLKGASHNDIALIFTGNYQGILTLCIICYLLNHTHFSNWIYMHAQGIFMNDSPSLPPSLPDQMLLMRLFLPSLMTKVELSSDLCSVPFFCRDECFRDLAGEGVSVRIKG